MFRRKKDGLDQSKSDFKVLIPALTFPLQSKQYTSLIGKINDSNPNTGKTEQGIS